MLDVGRVEHLTVVVLVEEEALLWQPAQHKHHHDHDEHTHHLLLAGRETGLRRVQMDEMNFSAILVVLYLQVECTYILHFKV